MYLITSNFSPVSTHFFFLSVSMHFFLSLSCLFSFLTSSPCNENNIALFSYNTKARNSSRCTRCDAFLELDKKKNKKKRKRYYRTNPKNIKRRELPKKISLVISFILLWIIAIEPLSTTILSSSNAVCSFRKIEGSWLMYHFA